MGWANRITIARAVLTVAIWCMLALGGPAPSVTAWWMAFGLFVVTAATDVVDGAVARRFGEVSAFGRIADPLVDKLLVLGTMTILLGLDGVREILPAWAVAAMLAREFLVTGLRGAVEARGVPFPAVAVGKGKMFLQCVAVGAVLVHGAGWSFFREPRESLRALPGAPNAAHLLVLVATAMTILSGIAYCRRAMTLLGRD